MATATKTWVFASDAEDLAQQVGGGTAPAFAFEGTDGNAAGCVKFTQGAKNQTNANCQAYNGTTGSTFASYFGVGTGDSISSVRITGLDDRVAANTKLSSHQLTVLLIDDAGSTIATLATINPGTGTGSFANIGAQSGQSITKSGSDGCRLKLDYICTTSGGGGSASVDYRVDNIAVEVTYTTIVNYTLTADAGSFTITGNTTGLTRQAVLTAGAGSLTITGNDGGLYAGRLLTADTDSYGITGNDVNFDIARAIIAEPGSFVITGNDANLLADRIMSAGVGSYGITGYDANFVFGYGLVAETGTFAITGNDANLNRTFVLNAETGSFSISGNDGTLIADRNITAETGAFTLTGNNASLEAGRMLAGGVGAFTLTGYDVILTYGNNYTLTAEGGSFSITGYNVILTVTSLGNGRATVRSTVRSTVR